MEPVTLADYQRGVLRSALRSAFSRGEAYPLMLLACAVPAIIVPAVFIAVAGRHRALRPLRYALAAALVAFYINRLTPLWNSDGTWARISSINSASAYGTGIAVTWGTMWALTLLVWTDPWDGERVARRKRRGPPETGPEGAMDPAKAPDEDVARSLRLGHEYYWQSFPKNSSFLARFDWAMDLCLAWRGVGWSWCRTPVPHFAPPMRPHTNELVRLSTMPDKTRQGYSRHRSLASFYRSRVATVVGSYLVLDACAVIMTRDPYFIVGPAPSSYVPWSVQIEHFPYPAVGDVRPAPPPSALFAMPAYLEMLYRHHHWLVVYRNLLGLVGMMSALHIVLNLDQLARVFFGKMLAGPKSMSTIATACQLWHYPSAFGSVWQVMDYGLYGFWGSFWHQTFREGFCAPTRWLIDQGVLPSGHEVHGDKAHVGLSDTGMALGGKHTNNKNGLNGDAKDGENIKGAQAVNGINCAAKNNTPKRPPLPWITRLVALVFAFGQSAILHGAASATALPSHTRWQGPASFFVLASIGIVVQSVVLPSTLVDRLPHRVRQAVHVIFTLAWLHATSWMFMDDQGRTGIWLFEPVPFSPIRFIMSLVKGGKIPPIVSPGGSSRAGHSAWRWYHDDLMHWYTGKHWWDTGFAL
ncbi:hypothetical protein SCUCBS95973_003743 [Sporothrix curviconia]|uniref:Wax synthase domain-containing protein n=1 Tax=Sporothrix curviconia TaxID=1260050 RepID=A0ABP0BHX2_9PEZI